MKFAYLCSDPGVPVYGTAGSSIHVQQIVRALERLGHDVEIFAVNAGDYDEARPANVHELPLRGLAEQTVRSLRHEDAGLPSHLRREFRRVLHAEYLQKTALPLLTSFAPDVIYERYSLFGYAGVELAAALDVPHLLEVNSPLSQEAARHRELVLRHTAEDLEATIVRAADALFVVSEPLAEFVRGLGARADRVHVVPTGVDPEQFRPDVSGDEVRARHGLEGKRVVGFVGSLRPWHDIETVVAAVQALAARGESVSLLVVGEGPQLETLRALHDDSIVCSGAVPHEHVPQYMAAMDAVVVPYSRDGEQYFSPIKLFEAMAAGRPVIGARTGQVSEVLVDGSTGVFYNPGDATDLADKITAVLDMADRGKTLGVAARQVATERYTWEHNACAIATVARTLVESRR